MKKVERGELKLTGGDRRGAKLFTVPGTTVRPALARMRRSLFDMLGPDVAEATVVDLFGGTGSLALEALSRGAAHAVIFETDESCAEAIRRNILKLKYGERTSLMEEDAFGAADRLKSLGKTADLIFVDPPYALYESEEDWARLQVLIEALPRSAGATVVLEHRTGFAAPERIGDLEARRNRKYGGTSVTLYA